MSHYRKRHLAPVMSGIGPSSRSTRITASSATRSARCAPNATSSGHSYPSRAPTTSPKNTAASPTGMEAREVKRPIDWRAVQFVLQGECMDLSPTEKRMVMRRLAPRMLTFEQNRDEFWSPSTAAATANQVAQRMRTTGRSVCRIMSELPQPPNRCVRAAANRCGCIRTIVEPHPNGLVEEWNCPGSSSGSVARVGGDPAGFVCVGLNRAEPARGGVHRDAAGIHVFRSVADELEQDGYRRGDGRGRHRRYRVGNSGLD